MICEKKNNDRYNMHQFHAENNVDVKVHNIEFSHKGD